MDRNALKIHYEVKKFCLGPRVPHVWIQGINKDEYKKPNKNNGHKHPQIDENINLCI